MSEWRCFNLLSEKEVDLIHSTMLKILEEIGFFVDNQEILKKLEEIGARVDYDKKRVYFSPKFVENFIDESEKVDWENLKPVVGYGVSLYHGWYLDPFDDKFKQLNTEIFLKYFKIAKNLSLPFGNTYAIKLPEVPEEHFLPYYHYLSLKFLGKPCSSINNIKWAELIIRLCEIYAEEKNIPLQNLINVLHVHFVSPLKFTREEAEVFLYFAKKGLKIGIGVMDVMGSTSPVTIAGSCALHLAQVMCSNIIKRAILGEKGLRISCEISPLDMKTIVQCYGRPEKEIANVVMAQIARRYKARFFAHTGHADAKTPGPEAGIQKVVNSLPSLLAGKVAHICCGLLSIDEVYSPIQLVIDREIVEILKRIAKNENVDEESIGFETIKEVIEQGGSFLASEHTVRYFKKELFEPVLLTRDMFNVWKDKGMKKDIDIAREIVFEAINGEKIEPTISQECENEILDTVYKYTNYKIKPVEPL
ncbi:MAG: trimethylamine methyltransferase family protein [Candidatus Omnitrophica bacterium]|nr:trimethylamine methyltransferase family protein [Candidatus Omnitrophota bacterium]